MGQPRGPKNEDEQLTAIFRKEAEELAATAEQALLTLERNPSDAAATKTFFRALHSMKGNAACVSRADIEQCVHDVESALDPLREGERAVGGELLNAAFSIIYALRDAALKDQVPPDAGAIEKLEALAAAAPLAQKFLRRNLYELTLEYPGEPVPEALDPPMVFADLADLGTLRSVRLDPSSILPLERLEDPDALYLRYKVELESELSIDDVRAGCFVFDESIKVQIEPLEEETSEPSGADEGGGKLSIIRVEAHKIDGLLNLAGELSIANARLRQLVSHDADKADVLGMVGELERHFQFLQEQVLGTRMIAIDSLFRPYVRLVRELSVHLGKKIQLVTSGNEVELDKTIVEQMREPLLHLVRNAVDHGIEPPEERAAAGKRPEGIIQLRAVQREGSIYLEIIDDGRGIDRERLRERAVKKGLVAADQPLSEQQLDELIFETGLSTARQVTNVSGRGIGMDIVRKSIEQVRGEIRLVNRPGAGTTFYIRLPLTLALMDGVVLRAGERRLVVPLLSVEESVFVPAGGLRHMAGKGIFFNLRGEMLPVVLLSGWFEGNGARPAQASGICVVLRFEDRRVGILVDEVVDQYQFVIKSLESNYRRIEGFTGATVLGDGQVALIVDVPTLVRSVHAVQLETKAGG